jgi:hypothetical protein
VRRDTSRGKGEDEAKEIVHEGKAKDEQRMA